MMPEKARGETSMATKLAGDRRALTPVVEKTLAAGIALLFVGGMMGLMLGGIVPGFEVSAGEELGERTLATAAGDIERTATGVDGDVNRTVTVTLPATIDGSTYELELEDRSLTLVHPEGAITESVPLGLPEGITVRDSRWQGGGELTIRLEGPPPDRTLWIGDT